MKLRSTWQEASRLGEARDSALRNIVGAVTKQLADQLDRVIFMALCAHFGGPYFAWDDLRGRCECVKQRGQPDRYLVDGVLILEIDHMPDALEPINILSRHEIRAGFNYRIVAGAT